jgi:hypothetical protein
MLGWKNPHELGDLTDLVVPGARIYPLSLQYHMDGVIPTETGRKDSDVRWDHDHDRRDIGGWRVNLFECGEFVTAVSNINKPTCGFPQRLQVTLQMVGQVNRSKRDDELRLIGVCLDILVDSLQKGFIAIWFPPVCHGKVLVFVGLPQVGDGHLPTRIPCMNQVFDKLRVFGD